MNNNLLQKNTELLKKITALVLVGGVLTGNFNIAFGQGAQNVNDAFDYPREDEPYSSYQNESFYPVPAIGNSDLPSSTQNEIFEKYGELYVDWVNMRNADWEQNRLMCAEDIHDFLYNYMKNGQTATPIYTWSKLLVPNGFQTRDGAWNDFDGDGKINGIVRLKQESLPPQSVDTDSDGSTQGEWDDWYGNGIPNKFDPFVETYGYQSIDTLMTTLGTSVDEDSDNDGLPNTTDPFPNFATFGDSGFSAPSSDENAGTPSLGNDIGETDLYVGLRKLENADENNNSLKADLEKLLSNTFGLPERADTPKSSSGSGDKVEVTGALVNLGINQDQSLLQIRNLTANTAYSSEQIYKQLVNNCVILAEIEDSLARQEYQTLVADAVARQISKEKIDDETKQVIDRVTTGYDTDGDGEGDSPQFTTNRDYDEGIAIGNTLKIKMDEINRTGNPLLIEATNKTILSIVGEENKALNSSGLTHDQTNNYLAFHNNASKNLAQLTTKKKGVLSKIGGYFLSAVGGIDKTTDPYSAEFDSGLFWTSLSKISDPTEPNNPSSAFIIGSQDIRQTIESELNRLTEEYLANQGFKSYRECVLKNQSGECEEWVSVPGSITRERVINQLNSETRKNENSHSTSDITNE